MSMSMHSFIAECDSIEEGEDSFDIVFSLYILIQFAYRYFKYTFNSSSNIIATSTLMLRLAHLTGVHAPPIVYSSYLPIFNITLLKCR